MATPNKNGNGISTGEKVSIGATLTAAAVAAAGAYFLYGSKNAAKNRKAVKSWALMAKAEVLEQLENAKEMTQEEYEDLIENVSRAHSEIKKISKVELSEFKQEMKDNWKAIAKSLVKQAAPAVKARVVASVAEKIAPAKRAAVKPRVKAAPKPRAKSASKSDSK